MSRKGHAHSKPAYTQLVWKGCHALEDHHWGLYFSSKFGCDNNLVVFTVPLATLTGGNSNHRRNLSIQLIVFSRNYSHGMEASLNSEDHEVEVVVDGDAWRGQSRKRRKRAAIKSREIYEKHSQCRLQDGAKWLTVQEKKLSSIWGNKW